MTVTAEEKKKLYLHTHLLSCRNGRDNEKNKSLERAILKRNIFSDIIVSFIPYFRRLVFSILVTLVCSVFPPCLEKCKQRLCDIFIFSCQKWPKTKNEKWDERTYENRHLWHYSFALYWSNEKLDFFYHSLNDFI